MLFIAATLVCAVIVGVAAWATQRVPVWDFKRSNVFLTGGSVGIGLETAKALVRKDVRRLIIAARREEVLQQAVAELEKVKQQAQSTTRLHYVVLDVADAESVKAAAANATALCSGETIDLLICNAGFAHPARFMDSTLQNAQDMMQINYFGCLNVMWAFMPSMLAQGRGRVVLTSSMVARAPIAGYTLYAATKAGLRAFAHSVDMENSCLGVRVQVVSPPDVETPGFEHENTIKSPECAAISAFGGAKPFSADAMGAAVVAGIEHYRFDITLGSDGWMLGHGAAAMEPPTSTAELLVETAAGGFIRLGFAVFAKLHYNIVKKIRRGEKQKAH